MHLNKMNDINSASLDTRVRSFTCAIDNFITSQIDLKIVLSLLAFNLIYTVIKVQVLCPVLVMTWLHTDLQLKVQLS